MKEPEDLNELTRRRQEKLERLRREGIDPFGGRFPITHHAQPLHDRWDNATGEELKAAGPVTLAGRILSLRHHGKTCFAHLKDVSGEIQLYSRSDSLGSDYERFTDLDVGDFIGVTGPLFRTRTGELTVEVKSFTFLAKSLRPLPEKWHGLKDVETRYRQRYVDLIVNPQSRAVFLLRNRVIRGIRQFLDERGFMEVETPMMQQIPGGAAARPFVTFHNALKLDLYLRIAPELYLKRLVVGGFDRVYEINRNFRNEGISTEHNPEFTMLEFYVAYADYQDLMELTEELFITLCRDLKGSLRFSYQGQEIDLSRPWRRVPFLGGLEQALGLSAGDLHHEARLRSAASRFNIEWEGKASVVKMWKDLFEVAVEPTLGQPTFVTDFPIALCPLSKRKRENPELAERFELFIAQKEVANAYSELNDPAEQRRRFEEQMLAREAGDEEAERMDEDFVRALEYGMPPTAGEGIGVDRLVMLFADVPSIRDVILFPHLRPEAR